jgi:hypothetical protein
MQRNLLHKQIEKSLFQHDQPFLGYQVQILNDEAKHKGGKKVYYALQMFTE